MLTINYKWLLICVLKHLCQTSIQTSVLRLYKSPFLKHFLSMWEQSGQLNEFTRLGAHIGSSSGRGSDMMGPISIPVLWVRSVASLRATSGL